MARRRREPKLSDALRAKAPGSGIGGASNASLGGQLSRRVSSGAITQPQAQRTVRQRSTLAKAYGPNWRTKVYGASGRVQNVRRQLAQNPGDAGLKAEYGKLLKRRASMLNRARRKLTGNGGTTAS